MLQAPALTIVTVFPETVHTEGVVEEKLTGSPELAVALIVKEPDARVTLLSEPKVIVCDAKDGDDGARTVNVCVTGVAAA